MYRLRSLSRILFENPQSISITAGLERLTISPAPTFSFREASSFSPNGTFGPAKILSSSNSDPFSRTRERGAYVWPVVGVRHHYVKEGGIKWLRRRAKEQKQRKHVLEPLSPVINQRVPLLPHDVDKFPKELFYPENRDFGKEAQDALGVMAEINRQIESKDYSRLFAVIHLKGKQFKVTTGDIIILQGYWAPDIGDRMRIHKILLVGGADFTMVGRPVLDDGLVRIEGTVVEKTLSYTKLHYKLLKRKNYRRLKFNKDPYTMVRINMIEMLKPLKALEIQAEEEEQTIDGNYRVTVNK